jgi:hypothetical protein
LSSCDDVREHDDIAHRIKLPTERLVLRHLDMREVLRRYVGHAAHTSLTSSPSSSEKNRRAS